MLNSAKNWLIHAKTPRVIAAVLLATAGALWLTTLLLGGVRHSLEADALSHMTDYAKQTAFYVERGQRFYGKLAETILFSGDTEAERKGNLAKSLETCQAVYGLSYAAFLGSDGQGFFANGTPMQESSLPVSAFFFDAGSRTAFSPVYRSAVGQWEYTVRAPLYQDQTLYGFLYFGIPTQIGRAHV